MFRALFLTITLDFDLVNRWKAILFAPRENQSVVLHSDSIMFYVPSAWTKLML